MTGYIIEEAEGELRLPLAGLVCSDVRGDELILRGDDSSEEAWVSGTELRADMIRPLIDGNVRVEAATATRDSTLRIAFESGASIVNPAESAVEAWEVRGPGYVLAVAMPGGGEPAVWDANSEIRTVHPGDRLPVEVAEMIEAYGFHAPTGEFEFRRTSGRRSAIELHPPGAPPLNRSEVIRFVLPDKLRKKG